MSAHVTSTGRSEAAEITDDNPAFDLNGDGIADTAYRPNDLVDRVLWTAPVGQGLDQQSVQVLRWAQARFGALPGRRGDSRPLVAPPPKPSTRAERQMSSESP
jgi:nitrous oxidase accessory protein